MTLTSSPPLPRWRSLLFVPAHVERFIARAHERGADGIILDLEDAVPAAEKPAARATLAPTIAGLAARGPAVLVRVNQGLRALAADLEAAVRPGLAGLVLPKVEEPGLLRHIAAAVDELEAERGLPPGQVRLLLQIETPAALFNLPAIAGADPRIAAMMLGPEDFCAALGAVPGPGALLGPNLAVLAAARAAGKLPMGFVGSIGQFADLEAFRRTIAEARQLGFRGALAVHPAQVAIMNEVFSPSAEEVDWARRVVAGDAAARAEGRGAFQLDGRMIDPPVVRRAEEILALAG
ncbi:CoA ester lyase [Pseudoroseomonas cervicalis]|uniref:HpcH/HpaI aldolase/citrate lyase family protein n=1 Tax=Teichococcus cervicalis TaxID=204525 RepID=UPI00277E0B30|nr:CoA ester lyase [Pseudoroseomonas cervicalis]MDQ1081893.1 citrate lyase subunit beta/citryl-CoA lyase [Pseudoroseomonas cervicalis]